VRSFITYPVKAPSSIGAEPDEAGEDGADEDGEDGEELSTSWAHATATARGAGTSVPDLVASGAKVPARILV
jgi:hypothetical protein